VDLAVPGSPRDAWQVIIKETADTLVEAQLYGDRLVCHCLRDAHSVLRIHDRSGSFLGEVPLPGLVSLVAGPTGAAIEGSPERAVIHFQAVSFTESGAVWAYDLASGTSQLVSASRAPLRADRFVTEQVFVTSPDGTRVPMFLTRGVRVVPDGEARVLLYGYGGFDIPVTPSFSVTFASWLDAGGMVAVANLRGGGEYGRPWHEAGRLGKKQNGFDDFCACAAWLASSGWSRPGRIAISGGSNGGLLVGACLTQHPELFGAAVADVGVFDMLRFHLFTIGWAWKSDYGDPEDPEQYRWLRAYSPLHNVRPGTCYPATLIMTGDHDDRVVPAHSYKFAAAVQEAQACEHPVLLRVSVSAGHGAGKPTDKLIDEAVDRLTFLELAVGG
jgi:prolyl oligopeptidase